MDYILKKDLIFAIIQTKGDIKLDLDLNIYHPYFFRVEEEINESGKVSYVYLRNGTLLCDVVKKGNIYTFELLNNNVYNIYNTLIENNVELVEYGKKIGLT